MREPGYNLQINNENFQAKFMGSSQCMSTSAWMLMSAYSQDIDANDDKGLARYVDDVEVKVGSPGIAEQEIQKQHINLNQTGGFSSLWWGVQEAAITKWLNAVGVKGRAKFRLGTWDEFELAVSQGPCMVGTSGLAHGTKTFPNGIGGHIILRHKGGYNDPFGNAETGYIDRNGQNLQYKTETMKLVTTNNSAKKVFFLVWVP